MTQAPPAEAVALYVGDVTHARMKPFTHRFKYRVFSILIDINRLRDADRLTKVFSVGGFNLLSFSEKDHGARDGSPLRAHVDRLLSESGADVSVKRVMLLCYPRILGMVFNPLSVYYCFDKSGEMTALVYEVRNTFGDIHSYVAPIRQKGEKTAGGIRQERDKLFYVSPFLEMTMRYKFRLLPPGDALKLRILEVDAEGPILAAAFSAQRRPFTTASLLRVFFAIPLLTLKVVGGIHWEALKLWLKGAKLQPRPTPPGRASFNEQRLATDKGSAETPIPLIVRPHS